MVDARNYFEAPHVILKTKEFGNKKENIPYSSKHFLECPKEGRYIVYKTKYWKNSWEEIKVENSQTEECCY